MNAQSLPAPLEILGRGLGEMNQSIRNLDASKLWLPITLVVGIVLAIAGGAWQVRGWAEMVSGRLDALQTTTSEIKGSLGMIADIAGQVRENTGKLDAMRDAIAAQEMRLQTQAAWMQSAQLALARQGFQTPPIPQPQTKE